MRKAARGSNLSGESSWRHDRLRQLGFKTGESSRVVKTREGSHHHAKVFDKILEFAKMGMSEFESFDIAIVSVHSETLPSRVILKRKATENLVVSRPIGILRSVLSSNEVME